MPQTSRINIYVGNGETGEKIESAIRKEANRRKISVSELMVECFQKQILDGKRTPENK